MLSDHCFFSPIFISLISSFKFLRSGFLRPDLCEIKFRANSDPNSAFLMHIYFIVECSTSEHQLFVAAYLHSRAILPFEKRRGVHSRRRSRIPRPSGWLHCGEKGIVRAVSCISLQFSEKCRVTSVSLKTIARSGTATKVHPMYSSPTNTCAMSKLANWDFVF